jgi:transcriptional regulator with XRE-family HTH domain
MSLYRRVRDLREDNDKTQKQIAEILNMQLTVYQRYERGERELPLWAAIKLANFYGVSLDYLVERTNRKK